jgi:hypothetical protein
MNFLERKLWLAFCVALALSLAHGSEVRAAGSRLSQSQIITALASTHIPTRSLEVEFLAPITLKNAAAALKVTQISKWQQDGALARIECAEPVKCVPFFVILHWTDARERQTTLSEFHPEGPTVSSHASRKPWMVRAGQRATLILENKQLRVSTPILCLESGSQGQRVRVESLDRKRIMTAQVVDAGLLRGTL